MRRFITSARCAATFPEAIQFIRRHPEVLVLCSSRAAADDLVRSACETALPGVHRITVAQLAASLAKPALAERRWTMVTPLAPEALAARVAHELLRKKKLTYFYPVAAMPGFAGALSATLNELRLQKVTPKQLKAAGAPGHDLAILLKAYEAELRARSLADFPAALQLAAEVAATGHHPLVKLPMLWLHVTAETRSHSDFLDALSAQSAEVLALGISGDALTGFAAEPAVEPEAFDALSSLRRHLFGNASVREPDASFEIFSASGEGLECVEIARRIRRAGLPFDDVAILLRNPDRYRPMVEEALRRAKIPAHYTRESHIPNAAGRAFLALLGCRRENLSAAHFAEYLSLGQVPEATNGAGWTAPENDLISPIDVEAEPTTASRGTIGWEKLLTDAAVIEGRERWIRRLSGYEDTLRSKLEEAEGDDGRQWVSDRIDRLIRLRDFALPLIGQLGDLPERAMWGEWIGALTDLAEQTLREPESVTALLAELLPMADIGPVELAEVTAILSDRLLFESSRVTTPRYGRVFVGTIEEARGMSFRLVFVPGLAEGAFPHRPSEDPLLLDSGRTALKQSRDRKGAVPEPHGLQTQPDRVQREHALLKTAVACASEKLVASYPRMDIVTGRRRVPSLYAFELVRAAEGQLPTDLREFERRAGSGGVSQLRWPAPEDPLAALDDAEFDLSFLRSAFDHPDTSQGLAGYLTKVNPHLYRSLQSRGRRWMKKWFAADGLVDVDVETLQILTKHLLTKRSYSPSALQHFAACPYRFYLKSIYGLRPAATAEPVESMEPTVRGELFHQVQFELMRELQSSGKLPVTAEGLPHAMERLDAIVDRTAASFGERYEPAIPRIWKSDVEEIRSDVRGWLREMAAAPSPWVPLLFEFAFGFSPRNRSTDPASDVEEVSLFDEGFRLRGAIDLIEQHESNGTLRITDHKTGSPPDRAPTLLGGGEVLQPILYALAAEKCLGKTAVSGRLYYATQRHSYKEISISVGPEARTRMQQALEIINGSIYKGFLPAAPNKDACENCDYRVVCGPYEEERVTLKPRAEIQTLFRIRQMP
jgi:ATP-dependent helicase/nuclease subunit B